MIQSENYQNGEAGFRIKANGDAEFNDAIFRGRVEATSGTFHGRLEATEGYFKGNLETPVLKASTEPMYSVWRSHASGKSVRSIMDEEFTFWGMQNDLTQKLNKPATGTYAGKDINAFGAHFYGRGGNPFDNGINLYFTDGTSLFLLVSDTISAPLSFRYRTDAWTVSMANMPEENPKIAGVLWRNGNQVMISTG